MVAISLGRLRIALVAGTAVAALVATAVRAGPPLTPIDTNAPSYAASTLGSTVLPDFKGGTLLTDIGLIATGFTVEAYPTNAIDSHGIAATFSGVLSGAGGLTVEDAIGGGQVFFTNVNTYAGATSINPGGYLGLAGTGSIAPSDAVVNGFFDISATNAGASVQGLSGAGFVFLGAKTLSLTNANDTFTGQIFGPGTVTLSGGIETLSGANSYSGGTKILAGTLIELNHTVAAGVATVSSGAVLDYNQTAGLLYQDGVTLTGAGIVEKTGAGILSIRSAVALSQGAMIDVQGGTLRGSSDHQGVWITNQASLHIASGATFDGVEGTIFVDALTGSGVLQGGYQGVQTTTIGVAGGSGTFSGVIRDTGYFGTSFLALTKAGGGTETLTGTNAYSGPTTISGGSLALSGTGSIANSIVIDNATFDISGLTNGGTGIRSLSGAGGVVLGTNNLTITNGAATPFAGVISGSGGLNVASGFVFLTGSNTYTGVTTVGAAAELSLGNGVTNGSIVGNVVNNGSFVFQEVTPYTFAGVISGGGNVYVYSPTTITLTGDSTHTGYTAVASGTVLNLGAGGTTGSVSGAIIDGGTVVFNHSNTVTYAGVISDFGANVGTVTKAGTGLLVLNGVNTVSGLTTISAGTLEVGDAAHPGAMLDSHIGGVTVGAAGTLQGHGTINGAVRNLAGGAVAPGGTIGTLTVASYSQGANSTLAIEVSPTAASLLDALGSVSLNGTLALTFDPGPYSAHIYAIVTGAPVSGTFSTVTASGESSGVIYGVYYAPGATQANLVVEPKSVGQGFAAVNTASLDQAQSFAAMVSDRQDDAGCSSDKKAARDADKSATCDGVSAWAQVLGERGHTNGTGDISRIDDIDAGFIGGLDSRFGGYGSLGVAVAYADTAMTMDAAATKSTGHALFASVYGRMSAGGFMFDGEGFYMDSRWTQTRSIVGYGNATSHPNGTTGGVVIQVSYPMMDGTVKPYLKVSYADFNRDATTETGAAVGPLALAATAGSNSSTRTEVGVKLSATAVDSGGLAIRPELRLGLSQDLSSSSRDTQVRLALTPTTTFTSSAAKPDQTAGVLAGAMRVQLSDCLDVYADLRGRFSANQSEGSLTIGGRYEF